MKSISITQLHDRTGHWLRLAKREGEVVVTERGEPLVRILSAATVTTAAAGNPFANRKLLRGVARLLERPIDGPDSATIISAMRDD